MKTIRLGNDIEFVWTVDGLTNVVGDKEVKLFNVNKGIPETITYSISGDHITGLFKGKDQKEKGSYRLLLYVNKGTDGMVTLDGVNAFELAGVSNFGIVSGGDESAITIATVNLRSTIDAAPVVPSIQAQSDWEQDDSTKVDFIKNKPTLFSGDYDDLTNKPTIPDAQIQSDWNQSDSTKKDYIKNKPSVPSSLSDLDDDANHRIVTDTEKATWDAKSDFSGDYNDLENKPVIPVVPTKLSAFLNDVGYVKDLKTINGESLKGTGNIVIEGGDGVQSDWNETDTDDPAYIKNKPTIPVVPTKVSAFQNDAGYINDVSNKQDTLVSGTNIKTINHLSLLGSGNIDIQGGGGTQVQSDWEETDTDDPAYIKNKPTIPSEVTESTVAGWGFTKNTGTYSKPSGGIPSSDLSSAVQTSLGKADTALQSETDPTVPSWAKQSSKPSYTASEVGALPDTTVIPDELKDLSDDATHRLVTDTEKATWNAKGSYSKPSGGIPKTDLASAVQTSLEKADTALQSFTETDPTVPSWAKASSKPSYTASEVGAVPTTRTVNGKALSSNISLDASDVGALPSSTVIPTITFRQW